MHRTLRELPDKPAVDGAESEFPALGPLACARNVVQNPGHLRAREVGVDDETSLLLNQSLEPVTLQPVAEAGGPSILPDDCIVNRVAGDAVPDDARFALVGYADCGNVLRLYTRPADDLCNNADLRRPDFDGIVLDPTSLREDLFKFSLRDSGNIPGLIQQQSAGAGRPLIERKQVSSHF